MDQRTSEAENSSLSINHNSTLFQMSNFYILLMPSLLTIILNVFSFGVVLTNQKLQARIKVCFIGHLLTDLGFGISNIYVPLLRLLGYQNTTSCYWIVLSYNVFLAVTSCMALLQTFDRFLVLKLTYSYVAWITTTKMIIMVVLIYICNFLIFGVSFAIGFDAEVDVACLGLSGGKVGYILAAVLFTVSIVIVACLYIYIARVVRRHEKDIQNTSTTIYTTGTNDVGVSGLLRDKKNLITLAIIVFLYIVCYTPKTITLIRIIWNWETRSKYFENNVPLHSAILMMANSIINPIIYIWRLKTNREDCHRRLVRCCKTFRRSSVADSRGQQRQHVESQNNLKVDVTDSTSVP